MIRLSRKHLVVHREAEQDREQEQRHPGLDRVDALEAEQPVPDAVQEDEDHEAVGGTDREQVERDRGRGDDDRAEDDRQQHEAQAEHVDEDERQPGVHRVDEVDVVGRVAADEHAHVGAAEGARDLGRAQTADRVERARARLVAGRRCDADRGRACRRARSRRSLPPPKTGSLAELAPQPRDRPRAPSGERTFPDDRDQRRARALPAGSRARAPRSPCFDSSRSGSVLTPLAPSFSPKAGTASAEQQRAEGHEADDRPAHDLADDGCPRSAPPAVDVPADPGQRAAR